MSAVHRRGASVAVTVMSAVVAAEYVSVLGKRSAFGFGYGIYYLPVRVVFWLAGRVW